MTAPSTAKTQETPTPLMPYYDTDGITIYHGDCREVLLQIDDCDLMLTDPPYGIDWQTNYSRFTNTRSAKPRKDHAKIINDKSSQMMQFAMECYGAKIVWGAHLSPWLVKEIGSWLVWDKRFDNGQALLADAEMAWMSKGTGVYIHKHTWQGMIANNTGIPHTRLHPNEKPVGLFRWCLSLFPKAKSILDPFMGSGTTLVAAKLEGRSAIGIEINEEFCETAAKRLQQGMLF